MVKSEKTSKKYRIIRKDEQERVKVPYRKEKEEKRKVMQYQRNNARKM